MKNEFSNPMNTTPCIIYEGIFIPLLKAFLHKRAAQSITPGFDVFVQDVIAAITTDPCFMTCYYSLNVNLDSTYFYYYLIPNPLNPTGFVRHAFQSFFI